MSSRDSHNPLVNLFVELLPSLVGECTTHQAHVDKVKWLLPCPLTKDIIHLKDTVRGDPSGGRGEDIHAADGSGRIEIGNITDTLLEISCKTGFPGDLHCPASLAGSNVQDVLYSVVSGAVPARVTSSRFIDSPWANRRSGNGKGNLADYSLAG